MSRLMEAKPWWDSNFNTPYKSKKLLKLYEAGNLTHPVRKCGSRYYIDETAEYIEFVKSASLTPEDSAVQRELEALFAGGL